ncbi:MAG: nitrate ABC transporter [Thalassospira sp.]|uniref:ABC transporter permease n=1 Tax=Thalassospira sp. GB04J01 TaxID=1485225 RepID=UPI000C0FFAA4|nr:ABC transporter permease [Thalassospira sp. GB04J01]MBV17872.1 nitrate ABC transporter [Thalassospira sp.]|tara:strand:- start:24758 stop:25915 length:1158 start_codon:yes stop_codon:yes gene_type:complete
MTQVKLDKFCLVGAVAALLALIFPLAGIDGDTGKQVAFVGDIPGLASAMALCVMAGAAFTWIGVRTIFHAFIILAAAVFGAWQAIDALYDYGVAGYASTGFWLFIISLWAFVWRAIDVIANYHSLETVKQQSANIIVPIAFGVWLLFVWEVVVSGFGVPQVLLPPPSMIGVRFVSSTDTMMADFYQTFVKAALSGYVMGCGSAFLVAIAVDRVPFLKRGLLPLGNMVSALPIIGVAPIMVMWFGFDWQSKAAVIVIMTFFPMLVNTVTGLNAAGKLEKDLMATYASGYWSTLFRLRLPAAMPFVFNALKINSTLALIGAIVAEFFGTPIVGMGFRISTEVGRMNIDMVWAEIALAALAGTAFYGAVAYVERKATSWHPSFRVRRH